jgi:hypothetical protein
MTELSSNVTRKPPSSLPNGVRMKRQCTCGAHTHGGSQCSSCNKVGSIAHRQSSARQTHAITELSGTVDPLTMVLMRSRFGFDFSNIRVNGERLSANAGDVHNSRLTGQEDAIREGSAERHARQLSVDVKVAQGASQLKKGSLSQTEEEPLPGEGGIMKTAQTARGPIAPPPSSGPVAPPSCTYAITYANIRNTGCATGQCGAQIVYDVTGVTATGSGCPSSLNGLMVTESVTTDNGCGPGTVTTGAGCPIEEHPPMLPGHGIVRNCTDTYGMCGPAAAFPATGCTETYTQKLFVGGVLAETRAIRFAIRRSGASCSGTVTRT